VGRGRIGRRPDLQVEVEHLPTPVEKGEGHDAGVSPLGARRDEVD